MSVWTEIKGSYKVKKDKHISLKHVMDDICDENMTTIKTQDLGAEYLHEFRTAVSMDLNDLKDVLFKLPEKLGASKNTFEACVEGRIFG
jgi:hypothetical protein